MRAGVSVLLAVVASAVAGAAWAQGAPQYFFCHVPDPASGTVFMSAALPVGPVSERAGYGAEFVAHLKKQGRLRGDAQGYCTMRPSLEAVARAQGRLPLENCPECGGAARFEGVVWNRGGRDAVAPAPVPASRSKAAQGAPALAGAAGQAPLLLVMGNVRSGRLHVISNRRSPAEAEAIQARHPAAAGWKTLLLSDEPGYGAAVCVREAGEVRFFVAHAQASFEDAARVAREFALQNEAGPERVELCGSPWEARAGVDAPRSLDEAALETIKRRIRGDVACDPARTDCPPKAKPAGIGSRG